MDNIIGLEKTPGKGGAKAESLSERKARLLRQGDFYRVGIAHARAQIKHDSRPDVLFHSALDHATWAVRSRIDSVLHPTGISVASIMPYAATIIGFITRRRLVKPAIGVAALAAGVVWYLQRRRTGEA
ncbi:hypothetical protein [Massilia antarctica]|nr:MULTISPECIES: hypothetical protein [Massilia]MCY0915535.1 hypothetical protein [Massilia sp. H27-R4]CUI04114.1 hypothetical protein BN2497_3005 [Janthinobacterium sp. CG23_2]CUU27900.1 hypothetical protein BN3177_3005 [Janthinobacterium sp. CG23_2]